MNCQLHVSFSGSCDSPPADCSGTRRHLRLFLAGHTLPARISPRLTSREGLQVNGRLKRAQGLAPVVHWSSAPAVDRLQVSPSGWSPSGPIQLYRQGIAETTDTGPGSDFRKITAPAWEVLQLEFETEASR